MRIGGKQRLAHRVSWELSNGPIPGGVGYSGTCVLHKCDVPACVNPEHLFLGTQSDNVADRDAKGRSNGGNSPGEAHSQAKLTGAKVLDIRSRRGESPYALAKEFGVSYAQIWNIRSGKSWRHI